MQRWEQTEHLPAHRQQHLKLSTVYAFKPELDRWMVRRTPSPRGESAVTLAVRDFTNLSSAQRNDPFSEGVIDDLTTKLSRVEGLRVFPRSATLQFRESTLTAVGIGKRLKASHVLEGSVRRNGNRLRINVQLIGTRSGHSIWAQKFDRTIKDVLAIQDEIAESISAALRLALRSKPGKTEGFPTRDPQAYELYLKGRQMFHHFRRKNFQRGKEIFARAVALDPEFALAHAGLADCCSYLYLYWEATPENLEASESASLRAVSLSPEQAETHASRGLSLSTLRNYPEAEREFKAAIDLNQNLFDAHYFYARACLAQGKFKEAIKPLQSASAMRPEDYQSTSLLGQAYLRLRTQNCGGRRLSTNRRDCKTTAVSQPWRCPGPLSWRGFLGASWANKNSPGLGSASLGIGSERLCDTVLYNVACLYAVLNRKQEALRCLKGVMRSGWRKEWIRNDPDFSCLRNDTEFIELTR